MALLLGGLNSTAALASQAQPEAAAANAPALYTKHCAECHGADRLGRIGPALLPQNLRRLRQPKAVKVITKGRIATQMPGFGEVLNQNEIASLAKLIYTPLAT
ncbi:MAG: cytochrome c, partial [Rhodospirillaceae bacterium]|nr:cytochrome c [Rhodospirillaceae bacterium]